MLTIAIFWGSSFYLMFLAAVRKSPFKYKHFYQQKNLRKIRLKHFKPHRLAVQLLRILDGILFYTFDYLIWYLLIILPRQMLSGMLFSYYLK